MATIHPLAAGSTAVESTLFGFSIPHAIAGAHAQDDYRVRVSQAEEDLEWDAFLAQAPGGHHVQTSLWAQVKSLLGWSAARVVVTRRGRVVAGAQMLMRAVSLVGRIGYVLKGPLLAADDPMLSRLVIQELIRTAQANRVRYLAVQPPLDDGGLSRQLLDMDFCRSSLTGVTPTPTATVVVDLTADLDEILARMKARTRYNIRLGLRKGVIVREGTERDLPTFYRLLVATSERQSFRTYSPSYFTRMWRLFAPGGQIKLLVAEYEGEPVSAQLAVTFGDTMVNKLSVWSGRHPGCHPNYVLQWRAMEWAKAQGFRYYDFEGIDPRAAQAMINGEALPDSLRQTVTSFKVSFGGQVLLLPGVFDYISLAALRWAYRTGFPKVARSSLVKAALARIRTS